MEIVKSKLSYLETNIAEEINADLDESKIPAYILNKLQKVDVLTSYSFSWGSVDRTTTALDA